MTSSKIKTILHIGAEKTGTTSLQKFLTLNREQLRNHDILFPKVPGLENHILLAVYSSPNENTRDLRAGLDLHGDDALRMMLERFGRDLQEEVSSSGCKRVIFSNEHCSSRLRNISALKRLYELIFSFSESVQIFLYLRRQDDLLLSSYSTSVKSGNTKPLIRPNSHEHFLFDYLGMLDLWSQVFGQQNIVVRVYDQLTLIDGDIISDFVTAIGFPFSETEIRRPAERLNRSLDFHLLEFLRLFNKYVPVIIDGKMNPNRFDLLALLENLSTERTSNISNTELREFFQSFDRSNAEIAKRYLGRERLFPERSNETRQLATPLDVDSAVEIAAKLWVYANTADKDRNS